MEGERGFRGPGTWEPSHREQGALSFNTTGVYSDVTMQLPDSSPATLPATSSLRRGCSCRTRLPLQEGLWAGPYPFPLNLLLLFSLLSVLGGTPGSQPGFLEWMEWRLRWPSWSVGGEGETHRGPECLFVVFFFFFLYQSQLHVFYIFKRRL